MTAFLLVFAMFIPLACGADVLSGTARDASGNILYLERHDIRKDNAGFNTFIRVVYMKPDERPFATMTSDFSKSKFVPDTVFEDSRINTKTILKLVGHVIEFEHWNDGKISRRKSFVLNEDMVASQGFDNFIRENSTKMVNAPVNFQFGIMSEADFFSLTGYRKTPDSSDSVTYGIKAKQWLLSLFVDELAVTYDAKSARLISFSGLSNIFDDQGKPQHVSIRYQWAADGIVR